jgi:hypothetical protein
MAAIQADATQTACPLPLNSFIPDPSQSVQLNSLCARIKPQTAWFDIVIGNAPSGRRRDQTRRQRLEQKFYQLAGFCACLTFGQNLKRPVCGDW